MTTISAISKMINGISLSDREFSLISKLVYSRFGINLTEQKRTLIVERLQKSLRSGQFASFKAYYEYVVNDPSGQALLQLVDKISTNHTYFFREKEHYDFLKTSILPQLIQTQKNVVTPKIRIWSAGCSSGEEAYTVAMILKEALGFELENWDIGILATDIAVSALEKAQEGVYQENQLAYVPPSFRKRFFKQVGDDAWAVIPAIKEMVMFRRLNLMNSDFPFKGLFQLIFCRNVMIYFDEITRTKLVDRFYRFTEPNGYFFVGHSESLNRDKTVYRYIKPAIYQKN